MLTGTVVVFNDLLGYFVGQSGLYVTVMTGDGVMHRVLCPDNLKDHEVVNPHALAHLYYDKLVKQVMIDREEKNRKDTM